MRSVLQRRRYRSFAAPTSRVNPQYTALGRAEGYCFNRPNETGGQVIHGDGLRAAAYREYGDQVDAIVNTSVWFVPDDDYGAYEPYMKVDTSNAPAPRSTSRASRRLPLNLSRRQPVDAGLVTQTR